VSAIEQYFDTLMERLEGLRRTSGASIRRAAQLCADALAAGGAVHVFDTGHLVSRELINRAGGLAAFVPLQFGLTVENPHATRQAQPDPRGDERGVRELVAAALSRSNVRKGDVLIIGTVSGVSPLPVELCLQAKAAGTVAIALTSVTYSSRLEPRHPSGSRLREVADLVIDNTAPYGDAMLELDDVEHPCCPFSGLAAAAALWALVAELCEVMTAAGTPPTVFPSINLPDGPELYEKARKRFEERGY
jgi:uncharacterized phosphosugar-binding protein